MSSIPQTLSVVIATYNRAASLARTLEAMCALKAPGPAVTFIIIDNASTDYTTAVIRGFAERLAIVGLHEPKAGKNNALNLALDTGGLGEVIVFTDDDVVPDSDWLFAIAQACGRRPDIRVFGGRIDIAWPVDDVPNWARSGRYSSWAFAKVDFGREEMIWPPIDVPFGPNYWVRREIFADGRRFNPHLGPRPKGRIMGDETQFLRSLRREGNEILYVPSARVRHCIDKKMLTLAGIRQRAFTMGRTGANLQPWRHRWLLEKHPSLWRWVRRFSSARYAVAYSLAYLARSTDRRVDRIVTAMWGLGWNYEMLRLASASSTPQADPRLGGFVIHHVPGPMINGTTGALPQTEVLPPTEA